jgi:hypothetical protein
MITKTTVYQPGAPTSNYCGNQHFESDIGSKKTGIAGVLAEDVTPCILVDIYKCSGGILFLYRKKLMS